MVDGPASIWSCHEYQMLERLHEAERGAASLCQLSLADHRGPWGEVVSDIPNLLARLSLGWPSLQLSHSHVVYTGPLPKSCRCSTQSAKGAVSAAAQNSTTAVLMGCQFWQRCFLDWVRDVIPSALRDGSMVTPPIVRTPPAHPVSFSWSPRFSSLAGTMHEYYVAWLSGGLTRHSLREVADSSRVSMYFDNPVTDEFPGPGRTSLGVSCSVSRFPTSSRLQSSGFSVCQGPPPRVSLGVHMVAGAGYGSSHCSSTSCPRADGTTSLKSVARTLMKGRVIPLTGRSRTPRRSQTPLAFGQRGDGDGSARSLLSLPGESGLTDVSCELPLC